MSLQNLPPGRYDISPEGRMDTSGPPPPRGSREYVAYWRARQVQQDYGERFVPIVNRYESMRSRAVMAEQSRVPGSWASAEFNPARLNQLWNTGYIPSPIPTWVHNRRAVQHWQDTEIADSFRAYGFQPGLVAGITDRYRPILNDPRFGGPGLPLHRQGQYGPPPGPMMGGSPPQTLGW